jgi:hypothetical protein
MHSSRADILTIYTAQPGARHPGAYGIAIANSAHIDSPAQLPGRQREAQSSTCDTVDSQRRRLLRGTAPAKCTAQQPDYDPGDELQRHRLRSHRVYSKRACRGIVDYRFAGESKWRD